MPKPTLPNLKLKSKGRPFVKLNAGQIVNALAKRHPSGAWVFLTEVSFGTGFSKGSDNHIDAMAFNCWPSEGMRRVAYEVKVSREDFKRELKNPLKRRNAVEFSHEFYFAAPKGLIDPFDLPGDAGLVEVDAEMEARMVRRAPPRESPRADYGFMVSALRKARACYKYQERELWSAVAELRRTLHGWDEYLFETEEEQWERLIKENP